ncbi:MAG: peroxiredoxin-like family protein [Candidatus Rokuibacteriota bacterium]
MAGTTSRERRLQPGDPAPDVDLPAADGAGTVSLSGYRGHTPVLLALFRGLYCPFCRRQMAQLAPTARELKAAGVQTVGIVATAAERARLYFRYRPSPFPIGADPDLATHRAFGLPQLPFTPEIAQRVEAAASDLARDLGIPTAPGEAGRAIHAFDGFEPVDEDARDAERDQALVIGQFLIDRDGIVRWVNVERRPGELPSARELLAAAAGL